MPFPLGSRLLQAPQPNCVLRFPVNEREYGLRQTKPVLLATEPAEGIHPLLAEAHGHEYDHSHYDEIGGRPPAVAESLVTNLWSCPTSLLT